ncbi:hypothetical protein [uncultured Streptococcus sp.]|uniref:hypothetical protein n=1 Tax=uncultured Streptococcus sp. TaxID=83427 RepID=UPI00206DC7F7|nr:hypothetical protein [uncultured Streptococcus sp.]DAF29793.1 MAG TPA: hypothetical protein [Caudoviricetes sp.]
MDNLNQDIQSNLALQIAQLSLENAILKAQVETLQREKAELITQLDEATAPQIEK